MVEKDEIKRLNKLLNNFKDDKKQISNNESKEQKENKEEKQEKIKTNYYLEKNFYFTLVKDDHGYYIIQPLKDLEKEVYNFKKFTALKVYGENQIMIGICAGILHMFSYYVKLDEQTNEFELAVNLEKKYDQYESVRKFDITGDGNLLVVIQHPSEKKNLKVFKLIGDCTSISSFDLTPIVELKSTIQPNNLGIWPQIKIDKSNSVLLRRKKDNNLDIYKLNLNKNDNTDTNKEEKQEEIITEDTAPLISLPEIFECELSYYENQVFINLVTIKHIVTKKTKKNVANFVISVYKLDDMTTPVIETAVNYMDRSNILKSNCDESVFLVQSISDESTKDAYYGSTSLYFVNLKTKKIKKISGLKEGTIHDFQFNNKGDYFFVCCGQQPSSLFRIDTETGTKISEVCRDQKVNAIRISPDDRVIALMGFGGLTGDMVTLDNVNLPEITNQFSPNSFLKLLGKNNCFGTSQATWSPDSKIFLSTAIAPYLNTDNDLKYISYNGETLCHRVYNDKFLINEGSFLTFNLKNEKLNDKLFYEYFKNNENNKYDFEVNKESLVVKKTAVSNNNNKGGNNINNNNNTKTLFLFFYKNFF